MVVEPQALTGRNALEFPNLPEGLGRLARLGPLAAGAAALDM